MKNKVLNRIDSASQRLESYIKQREELVRSLKQLDVAISAERRVVMELKDLFDEITESSEQNQDEGPEKP